MSARNAEEAAHGLVCEALFGGSSEGSRSLDLWAVGRCGLPWMDTRANCLDYIEKNWTDMRPKSLVEAQRG